MFLDHQHILNKLPKVLFIFKYTTRILYDALIFILVEFQPLKRLKGIKQRPYNFSFECVSILIYVFLLQHIFFRLYYPVRKLYILVLYTFYLCSIYSS